VSVFEWERTVFVRLVSFRSVPDLYAEKLVSEGVMTGAEVDAITQKYVDYLTKELAVVESYEEEQSYFQAQWAGFQQAPNKITVWDTGVDQKLLKSIGQTSVSYPADFVRIYL
jgi:2-oxoglutarate dehydrogenase complex dehydrogenase (E1) component-like enzyme